MEKVANEYCGTSFNQLSKEEMMTITGGNGDVQPLSLGELASGFVISWILTGICHCK